MTFVEAIGLAFYEYRNQKNMSQMDLVAYADMDRSALSAIENGRHNMTMKTFERLCAALEVDPRVIMDHAMKHMGQ